MLQIPRYRTNSGYTFQYVFSPANRRNVQLHCITVKITTELTSRGIELGGLIPYLLNASQSITFPIIRVLAKLGRVAVQPVSAIVSVKLLLTTASRWKFCVIKKAFMLELNMLSPLLNNLLHIFRMFLWKSSPWWKSASWNNIKLSDSKMREQQILGPRHKRWSPVYVLRENSNLVYFSKFCCGEKKIVTTRSFLSRNFISFKIQMFSSSHKYSSMINNLNKEPMIILDVYSYPKLVLWTQRELIDFSYVLHLNHRSIYITPL